MLSADLCGGRGSAQLHPNERIQSPTLAVGISAVSRAGRGCECCIGRFVEKGVARESLGSEIGGNLSENEKASPAPILKVTAAAIQKLATAVCASSSSCTDWQLEFLKEGLEEENVES